MKIIFPVKILVGFFVIAIIGIKFFFLNKGLGFDFSNSFRRPFREGNLSPDWVQEEKKFSLPVGKENLDKVPEGITNTDRLIFILPDRAPIYSIFSGQVVFVGPNEEQEDFDFKNIIISDEKNLRVSYLMSEESEILVKEGVWVNAGTEIIAKINSNTKTPACLGTANLSVSLFRDGQPARLTKGDLK